MKNKWSKIHLRYRRIFKYCDGIKTEPWWRRVWSNTNGNRGAQMAYNSQMNSGNFGKIVC